MAATILNSPRAIEMSVYVVRAFGDLKSLHRWIHRRRRQVSVSALEMSGSRQHAAIAIQAPRESNSLM